MPFLILSMLCRRASGFLHARGSAIGSSRQRQILAGKIPFSFPHGMDVSRSGETYLAALLSIAMPAVLLLTGCGSGEQRRVIGIAQSSDDGWRRKANREMLTGQYLYDGLKVDIVTADVDSKKQLQQVNDLISQDIDVLVVAPCDTFTIAPAIEKAAGKGIPVILYDSKAVSDKYTAYIGADNKDIGRAMGQYIASVLHGRGKVVEITGNMKTSPAMERHRGFTDEIKKYADIEVVTIKGDWFKDRAGELMGEYLDSGGTADIVFGHNDAEAHGAYLAAEKRGKAQGIMFVGVDGLPGSGEGIELVRKGVLAASYIYPTKGESVIELAMRVLDGKEFKRDNILQSAMVTKENAEIVWMQEIELEKKYAYLEDVHKKTANYSKLYKNQLTLNMLFAAAIILLLILMAFIFKANKLKDALNQRIKEMADYRLKFFTNISHQLKTPITLITGPLFELEKSSGIRGKDREMLEMTMRNVSILERLVNDILGYKEQGERQPMPDFIDNEETVTPDDCIRQHKIEQIVENDSTGKNLPSVLVVDDNADVRKYLRMILSERYHVMEATDGKSGLTLALENVPDIVVSDVMMPVMDGLEFCKRLKTDTATCHIPVILLTARNLNSQRIEGYENGADAYITKPFNGELLKSRMDNLLRSRSRLKDLFGQPYMTAADSVTRPATTPEASEITSRDKEFLDNLRTAIQENMSNPKLRVEDLSDKVGLSRVQMYRKIKAITGLSTVELLRTARLERSKVLLLTTDKTIAQVAFAVGFSTPSYFTTCFKQEYDMYPTDYRERHTSP